jgi:peptidyl-prolyl cis-trans isomerase C
MTHPLSAAAIALLAACFAALGGLPAGAQERVVAKVNGKMITDSDMKLAEAEIGSDLGSLPEATKRRVLIEFLIENQLFADAAEGQSVGRGLVTGLGTGSGTGQPFDERTQYWRRRALRDAYFDKSVRDTISEADARTFYASQMGALKSGEEVRARHILVDSKDRAREVYEKLAHGSDFGQLAKQYSKDPGSKDQGGELGFFVRGQMVPQFEEVAFRLKKGEISEPVESQFGWHIVRVDDRRQRAAPPFEAVKERVVASMIHKKAEQVAADLRVKAQIEYIDPELKRTMASERAGVRPKQ